jgi:hypothetical protein
MRDLQILETRQPQNWRGIIGTVQADPPKSRRKIAKKKYHALTIIVVYIIEWPFKSRTWPEHLPHNLCAVYTFTITDGADEPGMRLGAESIYVRTSA